MDRTEPKSQEFYCKLYRKFCDEHIQWLLNEFEDISDKTVQYSALMQVKRERGKI